MASLTIDDLDEDILTRLRARAAGHGRSGEAEAREILSDVLAKPRYGTGVEFLEAVRECMKESGGIEEGELVFPDRPPPRDPVVFED